MTVYSVNIFSVLFFTFNYKIVTYFLNSCFVFKDLYIKIKHIREHYDIV